MSAEHRVALRRVAKDAHKARQAQERLEETLREARGAGIPLRSIALVADMSHEQVRRLTS